jgi:hypothetical protein
MTTVTGRIIDLSEGRYVGYAEHEGKHYFNFKNAEGVETKFRLSSDAFEALIYLIAHPMTSEMPDLSGWVALPTHDSREAE